MIALASPPCAVACWLTAELTDARAAAGPLTAAPLETALASARKSMVPSLVIDAEALPLCAFADCSMAEVTNAEALTVPPPTAFAAAPTLITPPAALDRFADAVPAPVKTAEACCTIA